MVKRFSGLAALCIGIFLVGLFLQDILLENTPLRESMPFRMVIFSLGFIYFGWKWLRGDRLKNSGIGQPRLLPVGVDLAGAVSLDRISKILLIDADPEFQSALNNLCRIKGKTLSVSSSTDEVMKLVKKERFHLFIVSVELPSERGFSICNEFKKRPNLKKIPVVMVSHSATENTFLLHKRLGITADAYYAKSDAFRSISQAS